MNKNILLSTFPRSGTHLLESNMRTRLSLEFKKTHLNWKTPSTFIISILRDPIEVFASKMAMTMHYNKDNLESLDFYFKNTTNQYISFFTHINKHGNLLIKYTDLENNMDAVLKQLKDILGCQLNNDIVVRGKDKPEFRHLVSSKTSPFYDQCLEYVKQQDMSKAYDIYNKALSKDSVLMI